MCSWSANMSYNSRNVKLPFLTTRCLCRGGRSASWSAIKSSNSTNVKLPFLPTRCLYQGVDLLVDLPNLNTLCVSCFASQRSFRFYERPVTSLPNKEDVSGHRWERVKGCEIVDMHIIAELKSLLPSSFSVNISKIWIVWIRIWPCYKWVLFDVWNESVAKSLQK